MAEVYFKSFLFIFSTHVSFSDLVVSRAVSSFVRDLTLGASTVSLSLI